MTTESLSSLIDELNNHQEDDLRIKIELSKNVDYLILWDDPCTTISTILSRKYFLIKDDNKKYIGIIFDMTYDLHVFLKEEYRKKGIITNNMKTVVFPFLVSQGRFNQSITYEENEIGKYLSKNWDFIITTEGRAEGNLKKYQNICVNYSEYFISEEIEKKILNRMEIAVRNMLLVQNHISSTKKNNNLSNKLGKIINSVSNYKDELKYDLRNS